MFFEGLDLQCYSDGCLFFGLTYAMNSYYIELNWNESNWIEVKLIEFKLKRQYIYN